jgi:hypothetical protein
MLMARARNIKPSFFTNEDLAACQPLARLLFIALWCLADRDGRLEDRPLRIKAEALPYDSCDTNVLLDELHKGGFILRYQAAGGRFIQVLKFRKHQRPHPREVTYGIPEPPPEAMRFTGGAREFPEITGKGLQEASCQDASSPPLPIFMNPSSLNEESIIAPDKPERSTPEKGSEKAQAPSDNRPSETALPSPDPSQGPAKAPPARPRDDLFDAVAQVTASDPKASGSFIGRVCKALRSADPPYTPAEVKKWAEMVRTEWQLTGFPTLGMLEKHIGRVRAPQLGTPPPRGQNHEKPRSNPYRYIEPSPGPAAGDNGQSR